MLYPPVLANNAMHSLLSLSARSKKLCKHRKAGPGNTLRRRAMAAKPGPVVPSGAGAPRDAPAPGAEPAAGSERSFRRGGRAARSDVQTKLLASHERRRFKKQEQRILNVALLLFVFDSILKIELNAEA